MRRIVALGLCIGLTGCGGLTSLIMKSDTIAFDDVIEDTTNKQLLLNILRARDKAPLHFADIPVIRESMQQSGTLSGLRVGGPRLGTTLRHTLNLMLGVQFTPSFELTHLHSKEFNTGIATPIDAKFVKYWLDRGLDRRIVLLLFFSAAEIVETRSEKGPINTIRIMNSPREALDIIKSRTQPYGGPEAFKCDTQSDFERYLKLLNALKTFFAHSYKERRLLASGLHLDLEKDAKNLQAFASLDQSKIQLVYDRGARAYSVYALSPDPKVAFCLVEDIPPAGGTSSQFEFITAGQPAQSSRQSCFRPIVEVPPEDSTMMQVPESPIPFAGPTSVKQATRYCDLYNRFMGMDSEARKGEYPKLELRLHIRSVGEIFQFLGDLVHYQEEIGRYLETNRQSNMKLNSPVTFGYCDDLPAPGCDDIFIRVDGDPCNARFSLAYRDKNYHVSNYVGSGETTAACGPHYVARKDHTLEILAVLHQLVGLHKSAADVRPTPTVQVLP